MKRVGVADMVVVPLVTKVVEEAVGAEAHDNSMGGVDVINKHADKVGVICDGDVYAVICFLISRGFLPDSRSQIHCLKLWSGMALTASRCATLSLGVTIPPAISRAFTALFSATVPSNAVPWALFLDRMSRANTTVRSHCSQRLCIALNVQCLHHGVSGGMTLCSIGPRSF